jgi:hypothetical protein
MLRGKCGFLENCYNGPNAKKRSDSMLEKKEHIAVRPKKPRIASPEEVQITREEEIAIIEYLDGETSTVNFKVGPELGHMTDQEVLDLHNNVIRVQQEMAANYEHIAVEVPEGSHQIEYSEECDQWVPRGDVVRCEISDGGFDGETTVIIDDRELSLHEFGRLLLTHAGWGMRITFVPDDRLDEEPEIEVREPTR